MSILDNASLSDSLPYLAFYDNKAVAPSATVKIWKPTKKVADYRELNIDWDKPDEIINVAEYKEKSSEKTDSKKLLLRKMYQDVFWKSICEFDHSR